MPLQRIWNALFGRSTSKARPKASPPSDRLNSATTNGAVRNGLAGNAAETTPVTPASGSPRAQTSKAQPPKAQASKGWGVFSGGGRGDASLRKLVKDAKVSKVLEIFVGDGTRTCAALKTFSATEPIEEIAYTVIEPFERDPGVALRAFHRRVRQLNAQVRVIPAAMEEGLQRVAWTIGTVDLVLIGAGEEGWATATALRRLQRVCHPETIVLVHDGQRWRRHEVTSTGTGRLAA